MMDTAVIKKQLQALFDGELPSWKAHIELAPMARVAGLKTRVDRSTAKNSAVLLVLYPNQSVWHILFILRSVYNGAHSGQISFPGGQFEESDKDLMQTAIRETKEEVGVEVKSSDVIGSLSELFIPHSNFLVKPFVAVVSEIADFKADPAEVQKILSIPLNTFLTPGCVQEKEVLSRSKESVTAPCFYVSEQIIWGASAMILNELLYMIKEANIKL